MDAQLIGLLAVGATLIGVVLVGLRGMRQDMDKRFKAFETKLDARFDAVDQKFDAAEQLAKARFDAVDQKFDAVDQKFDAAEQLAKVRFDAVDQKFDAMEQQFAEVNGRLSGLESGQSDMRERMARLEGILEGLAFRTQVLSPSVPDEEA